MNKQSQEDYLRAIYYLSETSKDAIRSVDVAAYLKISKPSVSKMFKKLIEQGYIKMQPYSGIFFTAKGLREAKKLTHKHRIIEVFLTKILKINKKNIHQEAHKLEHAFSDEVINKLSKFLNNPKSCPGGKQIPKI